MKSYASNRRRIVAVAAMAIALWAQPGAYAKGKDKDGGAGKGKGDKSDGGASASPTPKFNIPIPVDHDAKGVNLPYYDERGRLQMYFIIAKATRSDLNHLEMKNAYMQSYDEKQTPDATVFMSHATLDLNSRVVTSDYPVTIRRPDFDIVGQHMVFNTQTRAGRMSGHVRMTIYNAQASMQPKASPSPATSPAASPAPKP